MASDDAEISAYLKQKWLKLTTSTDVEKNVQEKWWEFLKSCYSEPSRKYHTFLHLKRVFDHMELVINEIENKLAVSYAIFFHDTGYDPRSQDNEEKSVKFFNEFVMEADVEQVISLAPLVEQLIMASKVHCPEDHKTEGPFGEGDAHYFMDFDISILGSNPDEYKNYTAQIREEYSFFPKPKYNSLRTKVLQQFLQIPNIYATKIFQEKYEKQARCNIQSEIDSLQNEG